MKVIPVFGIYVVLLLGINEDRVVASPGTICPETVQQLEELLTTDKWVPENLRYNVKISPDDFPENITEDDLPLKMETNTTLTVSLRDKNGEGPTLSNCAIELPSYKVQKDEVYFDWERPENVSTAGSLYYEGRDYDLALVHSLFPVGPENFTNLKARYTFSVAQPSSKNNTILLNMPLESTEPNQERPGWVWNHYRESIPMWSDQTAVLILGGNDLKKTDYMDPGKNRTIALYWRPDNYEPPNEEEQMKVNDCILQWNAKLLNHFESRFGVKYPLDKLDLVSTRILGPTSSSATTTQKYLGFGRTGHVRFGGHYGTCETPSLTDARSWIVGVLQQWLGFIKPSWYAGYSEDTLWALAGYFLREGMALVVGDTFEDDDLFFYPFQRRKRSYAVDPKKPGLREGAVLQMLEGLLTKPVFDNGVIDNFMAKLNDTEATLEVEDLYSALDQALESHNKTDLLPEGVSMKEVIQSWLATQGKPWVRVSLKAGDPKVVILSQTAATPMNYGYHPDIPESEHAPMEIRNGSWIPLQVVSDSETGSAWLSPNTSDTLEVSFTSNVTDAIFFWVNPNITSYFGILYDQPLTDLVTKELLANPTAVPWRQRVKLVSEHFQFAKDNETDIGNALEIMSYLEKEDNPFVWKAVHHGILGSWNLQLVGPPRDKLRKYLGSLIDKALVRVGHGPLDPQEYLEGTRGNLSAIREQLMEGCISEDTPGCTQYFKELLSYWRDHPDLGNPFERYSNYGPRDHAECLALRGSQPEDNLFTFFVATNQSNETWDTPGFRYCKALVCSGNKTLLLDAYDKTLNNDSDAKCPSLFVGEIAYNPELTEAAVNLLLEAIMKDSEKAGELVGFLQSRFQWGFSDSLIKSLEQFYVDYGKKHNINWEEVDYHTEEFHAGALQSAIQRAISVHTDQVKFAEKYANRLLEWLEEKGY